MRAMREQLQKKGLAFSQTLEPWGGCRRGRSGVRPLRQPVRPTLLNNSKKMNPKHFRSICAIVRHPRTRCTQKSSALDETDQGRLHGK
jgi:hypothetical protein